MKRVAPQNYWDFGLVFQPEATIGRTLTKITPKKRRRPRSPIISLLNQVKMWTKNFFFELGFLFQYISVCGATAARFRES